MKKIGILHGKENTFPPALIDKINSRKVAGIVAERVMIDKLMQGDPTELRGHRRPHLAGRARSTAPTSRTPRSTAPRSSTTRSGGRADDKFFNNCLATKVGVAVPKTVLLPSKEHPPDTGARIVPQPGRAARLGRDLRLRRLSRLLQAVRRRRLEERLQGARSGGFLPSYDADRSARDDAAGGDRVRSSTSAATSSDRRDVRIMPYDPQQPFQLRYVRGGPPTIRRLIDRAVDATRCKLCRALGYDFNTVEFAVRDGVPYAIDFCNPAPDADRALGRRGQLRLGASRRPPTWRSASAQAHRPGENNLTLGRVRELVLGGALTHRRA